MKDFLPGSTILLTVISLILISSGACTSKQRTTDPRAIADEMELVLTKGMMDFRYPFV